MYAFRIKPDSALEKYLDTVLYEYTDGVTQADLKRDYPEISWNILGTLAELGASADNFTFTRKGVSYTDVQSTTQIIERISDTGARPDNSVADTSPVEQIKWPDTPIIKSTDDFPWFRKPSWYNTMETMVGLGRHISLAGPPGVGKSSAVEYLAAERGKVLVNVPADAGLRRRNLTGDPQLINGHTRFDVAEYAAAAINGWWVKVDEVNAAEPDGLMFLNSQIAPPYVVNFFGESYPVHPDFRLFITYNPGLVGTKPLPDSLKDRFFPIKLQFPTQTQLTRMLEANGMPADKNFYAVIVEYGLRAWKQHELGRMRYQITPRRLMDAVTLMLEAGYTWDSAVDAAVISAVDSIPESRVLKEILSTLKREVDFDRV